MSRAGVTGASFSATFDDHAIAHGLAELARLGQNWTPMMRAIGVGLASNTRDRFTAAKDPQGNPWAPLLPAYAAVKKGPGILRGAQNMSGGLQGSITSTGDSRSATVGSNKVYAAVHQFGAVITPKQPGGRLVFRLASGVVFAGSVHVPARPYLGFGEADRETVLDVVDAYLQAALAGHPLR